MAGPEVTFTTRTAWYSRHWTVTGTSRLALPTGVTIYISRGGAAHGYWRNAVAPSAYFAYSDVPALMPIVIGEQTWRAIRTHDDPHDDDPDEDLRHSLELHIRGGQIETSTKGDGDTSRVVTEQRAIHHALAADHTALLDAWQSAADALSGSVGSSWPPVLTVPRAFGSTTISLRWPPSTHASSRASIELSADARGAKLWSLEQEPRPTPNTLLLADRHFLVMGDIPIPIDQLAREIARADITSIHVRRHVTITIARHQPDAAVIEHLLDLLALLCAAPSEPYR